MRSETFLINMPFQTSSEWPGINSVVDFFYPSSCDSCLNKIYFSGQCFLSGLVTVKLVFSIL